MQEKRRETKLFMNNTGDMMAKRVTASLQF